MKPYLPKIIGFIINVIGIFSKSLAARLAIKLFGTPLKGRFSEDEQAFLKEAKYDTFDCRGFDIQTYKWQGTGDTVILAHGWESNTYRWRDLIHALTALDFTVISLDGPAHGNSSGKRFNTLDYSACLAEVAKKHKADSIIGHSVGGMATVFSISFHKVSGLKKIVLLGAPSNFTGILKRYGQMMDYSSRVMKAITTNIEKEFKHPPEFFNAFEFSKDISAEGLIIHDQKDPIIPFSDANDYKTHMLNAKLIETKGLGHGLKSEAVYKHITEFLMA
ncbi:alpha/beta fold hydrolase [Gaetbulibacter aestuarii]|uniref:Alpha/beta hydrolase n=1 Tax=Gaetbulibacter aestuarii TaxID=1502358 RepID=A0ABW7MX73_9FLAO